MRFPPSAGMALRAMSFAFFGGIWLFAWCLQTYGAKPEIMSIIALCTAVIFLLSLHQFRKSRMNATRGMNSGTHKKAMRIFHIVNILQWILIASAAGLLSGLGFSEWIVPSIILIVGLHFLPLWTAFKSPSLFYTGAAMILLALVYPWVFEEGPASPAGCFGAGFILWFSALYALKS